MAGKVLDIGGEHVSLLEDMVRYSPSQIANTGFPQIRADGTRATDIELGALFEMFLADFFARTYAGIWQERLEVKRSKTDIAKKVEMDIFLMNRTKTERVYIQAKHRADAGDDELANLIFSVGRMLATDPTAKSIFGKLNPGFVDIYLIAASPEEEPVSLSARVLAHRDLADLSRKGLISLHPNISVDVMDIRDLEMLYYGQKLHSMYVGYPGIVLPSNTEDKGLIFNVGKDISATISTLKDKKKVATIGDIAQSIGKTAFASAIGWLSEANLPLFDSLFDGMSYGAKRDQTLRWWASSRYAKIMELVEEKRELMLQNAGLEEIRGIARDRSPTGYKRLESYRRASNGIGQRNDKIGLLREEISEKVDKFYRDARQIGVMTMPDHMLRWQIASRGENFSLRPAGIY
ncbi:MAG: hypothetical protein HGA85_08315, partial [Nanoarchaeota archaeon]|nr:hypothetical protein [Nanoarchaeota archaeon]